MEKMRQAVMTKPGHIEFTQADVPEIGKEQALLKVMRIGVCGSDIHVFHGKHPYVSFKQADLLINYREHHGSYRSAEDLKKILVLNEEWINKISPYMDFKLE